MFHNFKLTGLYDGNLRDRVSLTQDDLANFLRLDLIEGIVHLYYRLSRKFFHKVNLFEEFDHAIFFSFLKAFDVGFVIVLVDGCEKARLVGKNRRCTTLVIQQS